MHAIIVTGGKQYKVTEGDIIYVEKLNVEQGDTVKFDPVLAVLDGEKATFGTPVVLSLIHIYMCIRDSRQIGAGAVP